MRTLFIGLCLILALSSTPALAFRIVPFCGGEPPRDEDGLVDYGFGPMTEGEAAQFVERHLKAMGIGAHQTRFWAGCIQTWVRIDGRDKMKFFDPETYREIPLER